LEELELKYAQIEEELTKSGDKYGITKLMRTGEKKST
jgi:hypothetical protein